MLNIYLTDDFTKNNLPKPFIIDVDNEFELISIQGTPEQRALISEIDEGRYLDDQSFLDRFGVRLYLSYLSSGCKAGLLASCLPDKIVNGIECGHNARDSIIRTLHSGSIYLFYDGISIAYPDPNVDFPIDVCLNDKIHFTSLERLNFYLDNELVSHTIVYDDYPGYEVLG